MFFVLALAIGSIAAQDNPIHMSVDASEASRRLFHVQMTMPVKPGPITLLYPQWIPGEHGPTGPVVDMVGLVITANGRRIPWMRDSVKMFAYHVTVPDGVSSLNIAFDQIAPPESGGFSSGASTTSELAVLSWNQFVLYPEGTPADQLRYQADLRVPQGWRYGTALPIAAEHGNEVQFQPAPLTTLIDSPVQIGQHYRTVELGREGSIVHYLHLAADSDRALNPVEQPQR